MPDSELVEEVEQTLLEHDPVVTTGAELSRELDESKAKIFDALQVLEYTGAAEYTSTGANSVAWWHTDRITPPPGQHPAEQELDGLLEEIDDDQDDPVGEVDQDPLDGIEEHVRHALPTRGKSAEDVDAMLGAVRAAIEYIQEYREAGEQDLERALYDEHSGPYGTEMSWYKRMLKPGLKAAIEADDLGLAAPESAGEKWRTTR